MTAPAQKRQPIPFGKYLLLDRVNIGGMAEVWRGKTFGAGGFERLVAIKRILPNIAEDEEFITMFVDEAKITVQLNHANIGQVFDLGQISNSYYIAMEYISGKDMRAIFDRCRKKGEPPPIPLACYLIAKSCEGLDYAHRKADGRGNPLNIVHRDVSPQNALVSYDGEVKVIDFGIAKAAGKATKTQAGILKGKFGYMSPEQIRGLPLDRRSDVFALGVCLYEMLTGERLFVGDSDFSVLEKVRKVEVLPPSTYNRKIPEALEKIVMKALAKDVDDRYQYASELADDLQRFLITTETIFGRKDLAQYMRSTFAEEVEKEKSRLIEYADIKAPEGLQAAVEMGYGNAPLPSPGGFVSSPSAVTSMPTMVPPAATPVGPPMITPSGRGTQPPGGSPSQRVPAGGDPRRNTGQSIPRLTAVAPLLTNPNPSHEATMLVGEDGRVMNAGAQSAAMPHDTGFDDDDDETGLGGFQGLDDEDPNTNPDLDAIGHDRTVSRPHVPVSAAATPAPRDPQAGVATMRPGPGALPPLRRPSGPGNQPARPNIGVVREKMSAPARAGHAGSEPSKVTKAPARPLDKRLLFGGAGVLLLVAVVAVALILKGGPEGLLVVELPDDVAGKASITVNGEEVLDKDGGPVKSFPVMRKVKVGKATVMVKAPGYQTLLETVDVSEGGDYSRLKQRLAKLGPGPVPPPDAPPAPAPQGPP